MVNEEMYDPEISQRFEQNNNSADPRWWRAEPVGIMLHVRRPMFVFLSVISVFKKNSFIYMYE